MKIITNIVVLIVIILILPVDGIAGNHRYNTCVDFDSLGDSAGNYMDLDLYDGYFYVCKIGYIEGEVTLGWDVKNSINANISIIVLNNDNLNNFISGNSYGHSNMDLAELYLDWGSIAQFNRANSDFSENRHTTTDLVGDNYYLSTGMFQGPNYAGIIPENWSQKVDSSFGKIIKIDKNKDNIESVS